MAGEGRSATVQARNPLAPKATHFPPKAKSVIFLFMAGAPSQLDLYDPKPGMKAHDGQPMPESLTKDLTDSVVKGGRVMASPRAFKKYGQCGMEFSEYVSHAGTCADDICMVRSMHTDIANHHPAQLIMNCGVMRVGMPCMGSWVTYGLGSESQDLPGFVVMTSSSGKGIEAGAANWSNGFLPSDYRGVLFRSMGDPVLHLSNPGGMSAETQRARIDAIRDLNEYRLAGTGDVEIATRLANYELAFRMQTSGPELLDFSSESAETRALYGVDNEKTRAFGTNALLARRLVERGVRFVNLYHSTWDDHDNLNEHLKINCDMTDLPTAGLLKDLKQRGLLDSTLVVWAGEFGRTPMYEVRRGFTPGKEGRDHHPFSFSLWMAGGGIKGGQVIGRTDDFGYHIVEDPIHVNDLHATILHLLGVDHLKLTYRHSGRDFRLTDVAGNVVQKMLA
jgi:hypothetical protein